MKDDDYSMWTANVVNRHTELCGGYLCHITPDEENAWRVFVRNHLTYCEFLDASNSARIIFARQYATPESLEGEYLAAEHEVERLRDELFKIGSTWYAGLRSAQHRKGDDE